MMRTWSGCVVDVLQDKHVVWLLYFRTDTSIPLATAMLRTLSTRVSFRACWRVKIHMPIGTHGAPAPSRTNLRAGDVARVSSGDKEHNIFERMLALASNAEGEKKAIVRWIDAA